MCSCVKGAEMLRSLSPRLRFNQRYQKVFEPWFWPIVGESMRGEVRAWTGSVWTEIVLRRTGSRAWSMLCVLPTAFYSSLDETYRKEMLMSFLDSVNSCAPQDGPGRPVLDPKFFKDYPALFEFLTAYAYPDGQVRTPSCFTVFAEDGAFKIVLNERDRNLSLWGTGQSFQDALKTLEERLKSDRPDWRKNRPQGARKKDK